jgi:hypothetical protein
MAEPAQCASHGLCKAGAAFAAENGATDAQLMAMVRWSNPKLAAQHRRAAEQKRPTTAVMALLVRVKVSDDGGHYEE